MRFLFYLGLRLLTSFVMLAVGSLLIFLLLHAGGGDAALAALGEQASPSAVEAFREAHHLNEPLMLQYWHWADAALHGDFGESISLAGGFPPRN